MSTAPAPGSRIHITATVAGADQGGDNEGLDDPEHHVLERVHVVDDPGHEIAPPEEREPCGGHPFQLLVDAHTQVAQHAQGGVVPDQALAVAQEAAGEPKDLDADDGQGQ